MGAKTRGNYKIGMCLDTCQCRQCRKPGEQIQTVYTFGTPQTTTYNSTPFGIAEFVHASDNDGSRFDKPMSRSYLKDLTQRKYEGNKKYRPSQYGA